MILLQQLQHLLMRISDMILDSRVCKIDLKDSKIRYVTKWIDYSNKFGFGYQLDDSSIGVIFNDGMRIKSQQHDINLVTAVYDGSSQTKLYDENIPKEYRGRNKLLYHFKQYMEENLADSITKKETRDMIEQQHLSQKKQTREAIKNVLHVFLRFF